MTTTQHEPHTFVTKIIDLFGDWLKRRRELNEMMEYEAEFGRAGAGCARAQRDARRSREAGAAGFAERERVAVHAHGTGHRRSGLTACGAALLRDMERVCSFCTHKRQCHQELAAGTAATNYVEYCENADTIDTLRFKS